MKRLQTTAALLSLAIAACAGGPPPDAHDSAGLFVSEAPLGGEALVQRKRDLDRALRDMNQFHLTATGLVDRRDSRSIALFSNFLSAYLGRYLDPMLRSEWQSAHAELAAVDASLRFAKAELLIQMRYPRRVQQVIDDIERRFEGRSSLLVEYPLGDQGTLQEGLELLKERKWKG